MTTVAGSRRTVAADEVSEHHQPPSRAARWAARLGVVALVGTAAVATVYFSFSNGGFFPNSVGIVAICFCGALVLRVTLADRPFDGYNRILGGAIIALGLFALLQLISSAWSHATAPALNDYDRTFLYVLVLALFGSLPRTTTRLTWLARSLTIGMAAVCVAGLISRVLPHLWPTGSTYGDSRLDYPLGYSNALGVMGALTCVLLLHFASSVRERWWVRVGAAMLFPPVATTTLLTYSRGALAVAVLGLAVYAVLGRPRGLLTGLTAIAAGSVIPLRSAYDAVLLSGNSPTSGPAVAQGHHVAVMVGVGMLIAGVLRAGGLLVDRWLERPHRAPAALARVPWWAWWSSAAIVAVVALVLAGAPGFLSHQFHDFVNGQQASGSQVRDRLDDPGGGNRIYYWRVGVHQFSQYPLVGEGAGTYQTYWAQHRPISENITDTHSLYLETLGEDGVVGMLLLGLTLLSIVGVLAWRLRGPNRPLYAALFAAVLVWAVHNAFDWDWQMPAVTLWVFAIGGLALASGRVAEPRPVSNVNRTALAACFLALAVAPLLIGFSYQRLRASSAALVNGNCRVARQEALSSMSLLAVRPEAYEILGYCDIQQSYPVEAVAAMRQAVSYDPQDWQSHYGLAIALAADGDDPITQARQAQRLNPLEPIVQDEVRAFVASAPQAWPETAQAVLNDGLTSGPLSASHL